MASVWVTSNPAFQQYVISSAVLGLKVLSMALFTARHRIGRNIFANPEDAAMAKTKVIMNDPDVERVRRAHLNDLENIPVFWILGLLFLLTEPSSLTAKICFYGFTAARISHTFCYLNGLMPYRGISFMVGTVINTFMGISVIYNFIM